METLTVNLLLSILHQTKFLEECQGTEASIEIPREIEALTYQLKSLELNEDTHTDRDEGRVRLTVE